MGQWISGEKRTGLDYVEQYEKRDGHDHCISRDIFVDGEKVNSDVNKSVGDYRTKYLDYKDRKNQIIVAERTHGIFAIDADKLTNKEGKEPHEKAANYVIRKLKSQGKNVDKPQFYFGASKQWRNEWNAGWKPYLEFRSGTFNTSKELQSDIKMKHGDNKKPYLRGANKYVGGNRIGIAEGLQIKLSEQGVIDGWADYVFRFPDNNPVLS